MSRIAIATDSNSGITQSQSKELGIFVLPMPFSVLGKEYLEDISLSQEEFYDLLQGDDEISTSQPSPTAVMGFWDEILKEYDEIVYIPMSSGLSGSCQSAYFYAQESKYRGKVFVVDNQRISLTMKVSAQDALALVQKGYTAEQIKDILEGCKLESSIYIMLNTLYYLKRGGRLTPAAAAIGTLLRIKPVLQIQGEKLDKFATARTVGAGKKTMIDAARKDIDTRFGGVADPANIRLGIAYTKDMEPAKEFLEEVAAEFPGVSIELAPLSLSIACHIGPGALAVTVTRQVEELK